jgi:hypothetical protein
MMMMNKTAKRRRGYQRLIDEEYNDCIAIIGHSTSGATDGVACSARDSLNCYFATVVPLSHAVDQLWANDNHHLSRWVSPLYRIGESIEH